MDEGIQAGHQVAATTRFEAKTELLESLGARPAVLDPLDGNAVLRAVQAFVPDVLMNQLTILPQAAVFEHARGAFNAKAKRELGWQPSHPSWRGGFWRLRERRAITRSEAVLNEPSRGNLYR